MKKNILHIVGLQGSGKSSLVQLMVAPLVARGAVCAVVDSDELVCKYRCDALRAAQDHSKADWLFLEHYPQNFDGGLPGSVVIRIDSVPELAPSLANTAQPATENVAQGV